MEDRVLAPSLPFFFDLSSLTFNAGRQKNEPTVLQLQVDYITALTGILYFFASSFFLSLLFFFFFNHPTSSNTMYRSLNSLMY